MIERCGDRQRKFDGLERWRFHFFIESLPIILQITLLLLASGLSRYMWSINTSVGGVIISFTVLGFLFYIGVVAAGTWSYECPFQTPASTGLRYLWYNGTTRKVLASLSPPNIRRNTRKLLASLSPPMWVVYIAWMGARQGLGSAYHAMQKPSFWANLPSRTISGIRVAAVKVMSGIRVAAVTVVSGIRNTIAATVRRVWPVEPIAEDEDHQLVELRNGPGLQLRVPNLERIWRQNTDNAHCVCWVLRRMTGPEAIDSATRLAGTIRWFDGDPDCDPPFDIIVSTLKECFDSAKHLYPGAESRAYFSARAILQINAGARAQSQRRASRYPIPAVSSHSLPPFLNDLHHILSMLKLNSGHDGPTLDFPEVFASIHDHSLWMSSLFVQLTRAGTNPTLKSYLLYLDAAIKNHQPAIANILLVWYMFLGEDVDGETLWTVNKSYVMISQPFPFNLLKIVCISDSLETILSHLSKRVMDIILDGNQVQDLYYLLEFLAAWEGRPASLTLMAYQWCSTISEAVKGFAAEEMPITQSYSRESEINNMINHREGRRRSKERSVSHVVETGFSQVARLDAASHNSRRGPPRDLAPHTYKTYEYLLPTILEIGFRNTQPGRDHLDLDSGSRSNHGWIFKTAFSSDDDDVIADAVCAWIAYSVGTPPSSLVHLLSWRMGINKPFSTRLQEMVIYAIEHNWRNELKVSVPETVRLLGCLDMITERMGGVAGQHEWEGLLVDVICLEGHGILSDYYWLILDELAFSVTRDVPFGPYIEKEMNSLEKAGKWDNLEAWLAIAWRSQLSPESLEHVSRVTDELLKKRRRPALQKFRTLLYQSTISRMAQGEQLKRICDNYPAWA